jgi:hypothetical protein
MANGSRRHADAATDRILEESERRQQQFAELLKDADEDEDDSKVAVAALGIARAALESHHDHDDHPSSKPPDMPWWARTLPKRFRWVAAVVAALAALLVLLQALAALREVPVHRAPELRAHTP